MLAEGDLSTSPPVVATPFSRSNPPSMRSKLSPWPNTSRKSSIRARNGAQTDQADQSSGARLCIQNAPVVHGQLKLTVKARQGKIRRRSRPAAAQADLTQGAVQARFQPEHVQQIRQPFRTEPAFKFRHRPRLPDYPAPVPVQLQGGAFHFQKLKLHAFAARMAFQAQAAKIEPVEPQRL